MKVDKRIKEIIKNSLAISTNYCFKVILDYDDW